MIFVMGESAQKGDSVEINGKDGALHKTRKKLILWRPKSWKTKRKEEETFTSSCTLIVSIGEKYIIDGEEYWESKEEAIEALDIETVYEWKSKELEIEE